MKQTSKIRQCWLAMVAGATLAGSAQLMAQLPTQYMASFDSDITALTGTGGNVGASQVNPPVWVATGAPGGPSGGALKVQVDWPLAGRDSWEECQLSFNCNIDFTAWLNVEFDVKVDKANSFITANGNYGQVAGICNGWGGQPGWTWVGNGVVADITTNNGWQHFKFTTTAYVGTPQQFVIDFYNSACTNTIVYLIDNLAMTKAPLPPPTLNPIAPPSSPGLTFLPAASGQWQRVMVVPNYNNLTTQQGWYNEPGGATYSFTVKDYPKKNDYGLNVFWIANGEMMNTPIDSSVDWNCTNDVIFNITANTNNPATNWDVSFSTKTNLASQNPNFTWVRFNYPELPNGKWTIKFHNNTDFTITAPNGFTTNASLTADVADLVSGNAHGNPAMTVYMGAFNRAFDNINVPLVFSAIGITNSVYSLYDNFSQGFDTNTWLKVTDYQPDIFVNTNDLMGYLSWNTPNDTGYSELLVADSVNGPWKSMGSTSANWLLVQGTPVTRQALLSKSAVSTALAGAEKNAAYFRLLKRVASKIQVLLPGETNAPGTLTGKIGTPDPLTAGLSFDLTVNACDDTWHIVSSTATVHATSSDPSGYVPLDMTLVGGTGVYLGCYFMTSGTQTITVSDTATTGGLAPGTTTPVTIP